MFTLMTAGKGGTGKSMILAHLLMRHIFSDLPGRKLVVDADPHQSLARLLGVEPKTTLGMLRQEHDLILRRGVGLESLSRQDFALDLAHQALTPLEHGDADLLVMGRNTERGCQCVVNNILGRTLDALANDYDWVVIDNEAGIEHIGRHTWPVDVLLLVASPKPLDLDVAARILAHAQETGRVLRTVWLLINRQRDQNRDLSAETWPAPFLGNLPYSVALDTVDQPDDAWLLALDALWDRARKETTALW